jgi:hypothetical protein
MVESKEEERTGMKGGMRKKVAKIRREGAVRRRQ